MVDKHTRLVKCPNCGTDNFITPQETAFRCSSCGHSERIQAQPAEAAVERLEEQVAGLREELRMRGDLSPQIEKELNNLATIVKGLAQLPGFTGATILVPKLSYVPSHLVEAFAVASLEAGIASSLFLLFLGLALDKTVSMDAPASAIMLLWLFALATGGTTWYFFNKARNVKRSLESQPENVVIRLGSSDQQT